MRAFEEFKLANARTAAIERRSADALLDEAHSY
jgi:hypothetical protein